MNKLNPYRKLLSTILIAALVSLLLVLIADLDQFIAAWKLYAGRAGDFDLIDTGLTASDLYSAPISNIFILYLSRYLLTVLCVFFPLSAALYFRDDQAYLKDKKAFKDNPHLSAIILFARWALGITLAFFILTFDYNYIHEIFHICLLGMSPAFYRVLIAFCALAFCVINFKRLFLSIKNLRQNHPHIFTLIYLFVVSYISCFLLEIQLGSKMDFVSYMLFYNILYPLLLQLFFFMIFRRLKPGAVITLTLFFVIGLANDIVYQFRGNYIMLGDLTVIRTAVEVVGNYTYNPTIWLAIAILVLIVSLIVIFIAKEPVLFKEKRKPLKTLISVVVFTVLVAVSFNTGLLYYGIKGVFWDYNQSVAYFGYLPYFLSNMNASKKITVEGYSADKVDAIFKDELKDYSTENYVNLNGKDPNIILIQNEAFSDLSVLSDIATNVDYMPFIHSLKENTQKGYLNMSVTGGPTANTEFEVLTGSSLQYFPPGSIVFTQYLKQSVPSLAEILKAQSTPYSTAAYHCYYSTGYNRVSAYSYLGFDEKYFEDDYLNTFSQEELIRNLPSDEADYTRVIKMYEAHKDSPFFCFNVTMQNHGGYKGITQDFKDKVYVTNFDATDSINSYLSLIKISDSAFEELIRYFEKEEEPTLIVMYGDHQPAFDEESAVLLNAHPAFNDSTDQSLANYYVPYIIWANYDIPEYDELNKDSLNRISTNYLALNILKNAGLELPDYYLLLDKYSKETPAITAQGVWDKDNAYYSTYEASPNASDLKNLEMVQYNLLFDKHNKKTERFLP
ncbi:MAG: LTA synthase family protein [Lachnospiraceae bacterium]|nr:LTA synthase family protein [Lachnospiraceae bacterium]